MHTHIHTNHIIPTSTCLFWVRISLFDNTAPVAIAQNPDREQLILFGV
jgi:hypothetical protein